MPWSDNANDGHGDWNTIQKGLQCQANWQRCAVGDHIAQTANLVHDAESSSNVEAYIV